MKRLLNIGLVALVVAAGLPALMFAALVIRLLWVGDIMVYGNTLKPDEQYELLLGHPPCSDVTRIEGIGGGWQGYDFWLRFRCEPETFAGISDGGFTPCPVGKFDEIEEMLDFQAESSRFDPDHFTPEWDPGDVRQLRCYEKHDAKNEWTESGYTLLAYEPNTGWVHLYSWGT